MAKVTIDYSSCVETDDRICMELCPTGVFGIDKTTGKPMVTNEQECIACKTCEFNCPSQAIRIET